MIRPTLLSLVALAGCGDPSCLRGGDDCVVASPCQDLAWTCDGGEASIRRVTSAADIPGGLSTLASLDDYVLENDLVTVWIEDLDHPHNQAITGGSIVDMTTRGGNNDSLRHYWQATGLLPRDYVDYTEIEVVEDGPNRALQLHGTLQGRPDTAVHTRYEIRPCEPGVRIRTEVVNLEKAPTSWALLDGFYFGGRENLAFAPFPGGGFRFRSFGLGDLTDVMTPVPFVVAGLHAEPAATYAAVACSEDELYTFLTEEVTPVGLAPALVMPRDYLVFERFLSVDAGASVSVGVDRALEIREKLFGEAYTTVRGRVAVPPEDGSEPGTGLRAMVAIYEGTPSTPVEKRIPWTHVIPDPDGWFEARVPTDRTYVAEVEAFGRPVATATAKVGDRPADFGEIPLPAAAELTIAVEVDGAEDGDELLVFVHPSDDATEDDSLGQMVGHFDACAPLLGNPHAGSPACNRVLVREGEPVTVHLVPGTYELLAIAGPFSTLAWEPGVVVAPGTGQSVNLAVARLPELQPPGTLSGDFHVHGRSSFDSSLNDLDRARSFVAADIDVIATTEHDVVFPYTDELAALGASESLEILVGTEMTGAVLWNWHPTYYAPQVVGHWNVWPLPYDPTGPYRGAPWDELAEPGMLLTRAEDVGWPSATGVAQLNHPVGGAQFGRDFGWISATQLDGDEPLTDRAGEAQGLWGRTPKGARFSNADYHVQEVMNGTNNGTYLGYREFWFYLLDQGQLRGGTANSDSHTLTEHVVGLPRTLVWTDTTVGPAFDEVAFDGAMREGRMVGTNGPVLVVSAPDAAGVDRLPSLDVFAPDPTGSLTIAIDAAPWVPVEEVRVWVNHELVHTIDVDHPADPLGAEAVAVLAAEVPLADLLPPGNDDAWIVVEAGARLPENADLDCDGWPETGDNDHDGRIDWRDAEYVEEAPDGDCIAVGDGGPLQDPTPPERGTPEWAFSAVVPKGYPLAFTNPLLLDRDGDGAFEGPGT